MSVIFINYRRDDSAAYAGRIYDRLANHFGHENCFIDIDHIAPGEDFKQVIQEKLSSIQVAVVLIGKRWLNIQDDNGQRRLDNPDDLVRLEIATLLARDIRVVPVLVGGAEMPDAAQLSEPIVSLRKRHAHEISDTRFHADVDRLIQTLEAIVSVKNPPEQTKQNKKTTIIAIFSIIALITAIAILSKQGENISQTTQNGDAIIHQGNGDINTGDTITQITDGGNAINQKTMGSNSPAINNTKGNIKIEIASESEANEKDSIVSNNRGVKIPAPSPQPIPPEQITQNIRSLYKESHALLIGVSNYTAGWPNLESIPEEIEAVKRMLKAQGFNVIVHKDTNHVELKAAFQDFIDRYGYEAQNRLLFFFSGHGETREGGKKGYLVPSDSPDPAQDERGFLKKALPMSQIMAWARQIEAKHVLYLFDSCFSGTVFKQKALSKVPPHISTMTSEPVRQFITAGSAGETVPAQSVFTPAFIDGIKHRLADLNKDGYVTGMELGIFLQAKVPQHFLQTPQFGKITDYDLSRGDFVFILYSANEEKL
jgi:Caspase domain/TIR domain